LEEREPEVGEAGCGRYYRDYTDDGVGVKAIASMLIYRLKMWFRRGGTVGRGGSTGSNATWARFVMSSTGR